MCKLDSCISTIIYRLSITKLGAKIDDYWNMSKKNKKNLLQNDKIGIICVEIGGKMGK